MKIKNIVVGHYNEIMNKHEDVATARMEICKRCPLIKMTQEWGPICNPDLYLNVPTNTAIDHPQAGYTKGCGCRLKAKTRDLESHCPAKKW